MNYFLKSKGISDFLVEIGGEIYCSGKNDKGENWKIERRLKVFMFFMKN